MMRTPMLGEFAGTLMLILLGNGVNAAVPLKRSKAENAGWMAIAVGWAFAVLCGIFTANLFGSKDGHLNPALTIAFAVEHRDFSSVLPFLVAQFAGAILGAAIVWLFYFHHWAITEDQSAKLGVFCTAPAIRNIPANLFCEAVATFVLVLVAGSMSSKLVLSTGAAAGLSPYLVSCLIWSIGLSLGGATGYAINPARDLGPRIAHALLPIAGKGASDWSYAWIPVFGPILGGIAAGLTLHLLGA
jgi:glycerol uptake facilitator protein